MADTLKNTMVRSNGTSVVNLTTVADDSTTFQTILSISLCNDGSTDRTFDLVIKDPNNNHGLGADTLFFIYQDQSLPGGATFIHKDKIMLQQDEELYITASAGTDIDIITSYLEQTA